MEIASHGYTLWVGEGHGLIGEVDYTPSQFSIALIKLQVVPEGRSNAFPEDKLYLFFHQGADVKRTADTLRRLSAELDTALYPTLDLEEALDLGLSLGVVG